MSIEKIVIHKNKSNSLMPFGGKNKRYVDKPKGKADINIIGCLLPHLVDLKLSEILPIIGSEIASNIMAIKVAEPV
jgi:hypothetical protein